jgi:hypothetical protein
MSFLSIQLASTYCGFIGDVEIEFQPEECIRVSTEKSNYVFPHDATLRTIAKTCWCESKPLLFRNKLPVPTTAHELLDVPVAQLPQNDQLILEIREKGNILYKD